MKKKKTGEHRMFVRRWGQDVKSMYQHSTGGAARAHKGVCAYQSAGFGWVRFVSDERVCIYRRSLAILCNFTVDEYFAAGMALE